MNIRQPLAPLGVALAAAAIASSARGQLAAPSPEPTASRFFWADFDGDGLDDAYVISASGRPLLLSNRGDGTLADVTLASGLETGRPRFASWSDFDADGDLDLFVATLDGPGRLFANDGTGVFTDVTAHSGLESAAPVIRGGWRDVDADGLADLCLATAAGDVLFHNEGRGSFARVELDLGEVPVALGGAARPGRGEGSPPAGVTPAPDRGRPASRPAGDAVRPTGSGASPGSADLRSVPVPPGASSSAQAGPAMNILECVESLRDQAGGDCLRASSDPVLGELYPLSLNLYVDPSGRVGLNDLTPQARLDATQQGFGLDQLSAVRGFGVNGPTVGHLGAQGLDDFDGVTSADWSGLELGVVGLSVGGSTVDNFGVMGHSNFVGVRGEHSTEPAVTFAELGVTGGIGLRAAGSASAADLLGNVDITGGDLTHAGGNIHTDGQMVFESSGIGTSTGLWENSGGSVTVEIDGELSTGGGMNLYNDAGSLTMTLDSDNGGDGAIFLRNQNGATRINLDGGATDLGGDLTVYAADGSVGVFLDGDNAFDGGQLSVRNDAGQSTIDLNGDTNIGNSGQITMWDRAAGQSTVTLRGVDAAGTGAELLMEASNGTVTVDIDGDNGGGGIQLLEADGSVACDLMGTIYDYRDSSGSSTWIFNRQTGLQSVVADTGEDGERLFYGLEATEPRFEDFGSARLEDGTAVVQLDRTFRAAVTIDAAHPMQVFVTMNGETNGVWVEKGADRFVVRERDGGRSDAAFDWRVVATRRGSEGVRLESWQAIALAEALALDADLAVQDLGAPPTPEEEPGEDPGEPGGEEARRAPMAPERAEREEVKVPSVADPAGPRSR